MQHRVKNVVRNNVGFPHWSWSLCSCFVLLLVKMERVFGLVSSSGLIIMIRGKRAIWREHMLDCHSGTLHWCSACRCKGSQLLTIQRAEPIMTRRSKIITHKPTNTAIPHLDEQAHSLYLSLTLSSLQQVQPHLNQWEHFHVYFGFLHIFSPPSLSLLHHLPPSLFRTPVCQASQPGWGLVLASQWAMPAFFPHSGLLSGVFALACVQLGLLYPHYWLQVMFWTQSSWPRRGLRYIIVRRGTSGDQTEVAHVLSSLTLSSYRIRQQMLWTQTSEVLIAEPRRKISTVEHEIMLILRRQSSSLQLPCFLTGLPRATYSSSPSPFPSAC